MTRRRFRRTRRLVATCRSLGEAEDFTDRDALKAKLAAAGLSYRIDYLHRNGDPWIQVHWIKEIAGVVQDVGLTCGGETEARAIARFFIEADRKGLLNTEVVG